MFGVQLVICVNSIPVAWSSEKDDKSNDIHRSVQPIDRTNLRTLHN